MARIERARKAFLEGNIEEARKAHEDEAIKEEPWHRMEAGRYIEPAVYGATGGIITTFAVVAGVAGASLSPKIVLILGLANLLADGFSMAVGDYYQQNRGSITKDLSGRGKSGKWRISPKLKN